MTGIGVSPAFVVARHGTALSIPDYVASLEAAGSLGFGCFQPEVYRAEALADWIDGGARRIDEAARRLDLRASQFIAHFLLDGFSTPQRLSMIDDDLDAFQRCLDLTGLFQGCSVITVPIGPFRPDDTPQDTGAAWYGDLRARMADKVGAFLACATSRGLRLALEILPRSLLSNVDGFLRLRDELERPGSLGLNLDTGHALAQGENLELLPWKAQGLVFGTHLKDIGTDCTRALPPGRGSIRWDRFLRALQESGYQGSLDLEITCAAHQAGAEYAVGLATLRHVLARERTAD